MSKELIESIISLGKKKKVIELELEMPENSLAGMLKGSRPIPWKWQLKLQEYVNRHTVTPKDAQYHATTKESIPTDPKNESGVNEDEVKEQRNTETSEFDFSGDIFLTIEKHTKYPSKERPKEKGEAIEWDKLKKEYDNKIRQAWAVYKEKGGDK